MELGMTIKSYMPFLGLDLIDPNSSFHKIFLKRALTFWRTVKKTKNCFHNSCDLQSKLRELRTDLRQTGEGKRRMESALYQTDGQTDTHCDSLSPKHP